MADKELLVTQAETLAARIRAAPSARRLDLQPRLGEVLKKLSSGGIQVPRNIRLLNDELLDEAMEARFDNIPI